MNDWMAAVVWLAANGLLAGTARLWTRRLFSEDGFAQTIGHVAILAWACVVANTLALGTLGVLSAASLLGSVSATCAIGLAGLWLSWLRTPRVKVIVGSDGGSTGDRSPQQAARSVEQEQIEGSRSGQDVLPTYGWSVAWGYLAGFAVAIVVFRGILSFPEDWDSLAYHIPLIDHWLREGTLYVPDCAFWYFPGNNEILGLWFVAPFSGDYLIALNNLPAAVLLGVASVQLAALLGISPMFRNLASLAIVATVPMLRQLISSENDIAVAALFSATLVYAIRYARTQRWSDLIVGSLAFGLLVGTKYYALGYAAVAWSSLVGLAAVRRGVGAAVKAVAVGVAAAFLLGGYWYLRNLYVTGTPLYPLGFSKSTDLWGVMRPGSFTSTLLGVGRAAVWPMILEAIGKQAGVCQLVAVLLSPTIGVWLICSALASRELEAFAKASRMLLLLLIVLSGLVFLVTPNTVETARGAMNMIRSQYHPIRFSLSFLTMAVLGLAVVLDDIGRLWRVAPGCDPTTVSTSDAAAHRYDISAARRWISRLLGCVFCLACVGAVFGQLVSRVWQYVTIEALLTAFDLLLVGIVACVAYHGRCSRLKRRGVIVTLLCLIPAVPWTCQSLSAGWHRDFVTFYDARYRTDVFTALENLDPSRERIAVCDYRYYPFFGSRRQFNVCRPLWISDEARLLDYVREHGITVLAVTDGDGNPHRLYVHTKEWVTRRADVFELFREAGRYTLYRVRRERLEHAFSDSRSPQ